MFGGKIKTNTFFPLSKSALVGHEKASLLLWHRGKRMTSQPCCTLRDKDRMAWFPQYPFSQRVWCRSKIFMYSCVQWLPVQYPWLMPCSNQRVQKRKQGCVVAKSRQIPVTGSPSSFYSFSYQHQTSCTAQITIHLSFFLTEITDLLEPHQ